jgi:hypothetical protein
MIARLGIEYDNMGQTQSFRESGKAPEKNEGLPWGTWEQYPYMIKHNEKQYLRLYADKNQIKTEYYIDGEKVDKDVIKDLLLASEFKKVDEDTQQLIMTVSLDSILKIK